MRFGNTSYELRRGVTAGFVIGLIAFIFSAVMLVFYEKLPLDRLIPLTFIIITPPLAIALGIAPTLIFSIHIEKGWVEHRIMNRWTVSRARASNFVMMQPPMSFPAKLIFSDGTKIRILGASLTSLQDLESELQRRIKQGEQDEWEMATPRRPSDQF